MNVTRPLEHGCRFDSQQCKVARRSIKPHKPYRANLPDLVIWRDATPGFQIPHQSVAKPEVLLEATLEPRKCR